MDGEGQVRRRRRRRRRTRAMELCLCSSRSSSMYSTHTSLLLFNLPLPLGSTSCRPHLPVLPPSQSLQNLAFPPALRLQDAARDLMIWTASNTVAATGKKAKWAENRRCARWGAARKKVGMAQGWSGTKWAAAEEDMNWATTATGKKQIKRVANCACRIVPETGASVPSSLAVDFELKEGQSRFFHELPSGMRMEVIEQRGNSPEAARAPLLFVHGSFHAAWCWAVHWLPFFAAQGHDCFALSLLGQGESDVPQQLEAGTLTSHARCIAHFIQQKLAVPPVLIGHSFGGLIVQQYLSFVSELNPQNQPALMSEVWKEPYPPLAAAVLACSVPPTGNGGLVRRYIMTKPIASIKVTLSLAAKAFSYNLSLCRETFFSPDMPLPLVQGYQKLLASSSNIPLFNLRELNATLPVPPPPTHPPAVLVLGAQNDFVVDKEGLQETASFYGTDPVIIPGIAHDVMLDTTWEKAADTLSLWLRNEGL